MTRKRVRILDKIETMVAICPVQNTNARGYQY